MKKPYYVYHLIDPRTGIPFYVGKGSGKRMNSHLRCVVNGHIPNGNPYLANKIRKILSLGMDVECRPIISGISEEDAFEIEIQEIKKYGIRGNGCLCNLTEGGEGPSGRKASPEEVEANRQRALKNFSDPDYRKRYESGRNTVDWNLVRKRQSKTLKLRFSTDSEFLKRHRHRMKKIHSSKEAIAANSKRMTEFYQSHPEQKETLSAIQKRLWASGHYNLSRVKRWTFISPDGNVETFLNLSSFCREHQLTEANMRAVAAGRRKTHKGWTL